MRVTGDVDVAQGFPYFIAASGAFDPGSGLLYSGINDDLFAIIFTVHEDKADDPSLNRLVELYYNSKAVRQQLDTSNYRRFALWQGCDEVWHASMCVICSGFDEFS